MWYRKGKRMIKRVGDGRFAKTELRDLGGSCCQKCNKLFVPDLKAAEDEYGFIDPFLFNKLRQFCPECLQKENS
jgi:hypothetical protein